MPEDPPFHSESSKPDARKVVQKKGSSRNLSEILDGTPPSEKTSLCKGLCRVVILIPQMLCLCLWCLCQCLRCRWRQVWDTSCSGGYVGGLIIHGYERLFYNLDFFFAKQRSQAVLMLSVGFVQVAIAGTMYMFVWNYSDWEDDPRPEEDVIPILEGVWHSWTFMADPGTHSPALLPEQRAIAALVTIGGIIFFASVLGLTVDIIREKMDNLRKGKSKIVEDNHTLVLGWTQQTLHIIEEICNANESEGGGVVVVLAMESKEHMESELRLQLPPRRLVGTRVVIRHGSPLMMSDLLRVSAHKAKAIVLLAGAGAEADEADANTVRTVLSMKTAYGSEMRGHIIAEVRDIDNEPLLRTVSDNSVEIVVSHDMIGRLMLMSVRQPGLAKVYEALLGFEGAEFYIQEWPELVGKKFGDLQLYFPDAVPIGVYLDDDTCILKPDPERIMQEGDELVVIAEDNDSYQPEDRWVSDSPDGDPPRRPEVKLEDERVLLCGWRRDVRDILKQLDITVSYGTQVHMMTHCVPVAQREKVLHDDGFDCNELENIILVHHYGNTSVRRQLEKLPIETYTSCMIFADQAFENDVMYADSHSLATLLLLCDIRASRVLPGAHSDNHQWKRQASPASVASNKTTVERLTALCKHGGVCPIVCEVLAPQTQQTIKHSKQLGQLADFCQTNKLIAQVMAMVSEERAVKNLLDELLGAKGANIGVVPASRYTWPQEQISFFQLSQRAARFSEVLLGCQVRGKGDRTVLNPSNKGERRVWDGFDFAILQGAEEEAKRIDLATASRSASESLQSFFGGQGMAPGTPLASGRESRDTGGFPSKLRASIGLFADFGVIEEEALPIDSSQNSNGVQDAWMAALTPFSTEERMKMSQHLADLEEALSLTEAQSVYGSSGTAFEPDEHEQIAVSQIMTHGSEQSVSAIRSLKTGNVDAPIPGTFTRQVSVKT